MSDNLNSAVDHTPEVDEDEADENIISLTDDQGRTSEYMILDAIDTQEGKFVALLPLASIDEETGDGEKGHFQPQTAPSTKKQKPPEKP